MSRRTWQGSPRTTRSGSGCTVRCHGILGERPRVVSLQGEPCLQWAHVCASVSTKTYIARPPLTLRRSGNLRPVQALTAVPKGPVFNGPDGQPAAARRKGAEKTNRRHSFLRHVSRLLFLRGVMYLYHARPWYVDTDSLCNSYDDYDSVFRSGPLRPSRIRRCNAPDPRPSARSRSQSPPPALIVRGRACVCDHVLVGEARAKRCAP